MLVEVAGEAAPIILDLGTGARYLGADLVARHPEGSLRATALITHLHWDHIQGLPFFQPLNTKGNSVRIYGAAQEGIPLEEILDRQMDPVVFPVPLKALARQLDVEVLEVVRARAADADFFQVRWTER